MTAQSEAFEMYTVSVGGIEAMMPEELAAFRAGWNARGEADIEAIKARLTDGEMFREIKMGELFEAIRNLKEEA